MAFMIVLLTASGEAALLFLPKPPIDDILIGRILGTLDSALFLVLTFYFGQSQTHQQPRGQRAEDKPA